jgi:hypothetical protein
MIVLVVVRLVLQNEAMGKGGMTGLCQSRRLG